jgi:hypothetical protein
MRSLFLAAIATLAMANAAGAQQQPGRKHEPAAGPYRMDIQGHCHAANGQIVSANLCPPLTYHLAANGECYASNGRNVPVYFCRH